MSTYNIAVFNTNIGNTYIFQGIIYTLQNGLADYTYYSPENQTNIPENSFISNNYLVNFIVGSNVLTIDQQAFRYSNSLTNITLSSSITDISFYAFDSCVSLISINFPSSITLIGDGAFRYCSTLTNIIFNTTTIPVIESTGVFLFTPNNCEVYVPNKLDSLNTNKLTTNGILEENIISPPCFKEGSEILTNKGYIPIEKLKNGDLVKTLKNGYLPIVIIGKSKIYNSGDEERIKNRLYNLSCKNYSELSKDLVLTGCHSILVDTLTTFHALEIGGEIKRLYITDDKLRLFCYLDPKSLPYDKEGIFTIYHIALKNENYYGNYGIYANGLLVETCSIRYLKEKSNMELIN